MLYPIPPQYSEIFARHAADGEVAEYCFRADLMLDGRFGDAIVILNSRRIVSFDRTGEPRHVLMCDLQGVETEELFCSSKLTALVDGGRVTLARYSKNCVAEFNLLRRIIDDYRCGRKPVLPDELERSVCVSCGTPLPDQGATCPRCLSRHYIGLRLLGLLTAHKLHVALLVGSSCLAVAFSMLPPYTYKMIADRVLLGEKPNELPYWAAIMAVAFFFESVFRFVTTWINAQLGAEIVGALRSQLHTKAQQLRMTYHNRHDSGEIIGRIMHDSGELQNFIVDGLPFFLVNVLSSTSIAAILILINWRLALFVFLPVPVLIFGGKYFWSKLRPMFHKFGNRRGRIHTILSESLRGVRAVKSMSQEDRRSRQFDGENDRLIAVDVGLSRVFASFFSSMSLAMGLGITLVWYFGSRWILLGPSEAEPVELGTLLAFAGYTAMFYGPLQWFSAVFNWMGNALASAERVFAVLDQPIETHGGSTKRIGHTDGQITFRDVHFSYERGTEVIKGFDLEIAAGSMIGLVGKSGAGKSTIINLLCRFYDPDSGAILIDGEDLKGIELRDWRRKIGIVMQAPFLFDATIEENISYGTPHASFREVVAAAKRAQAHDFITKKEDGYDTLVSSVSLSGGEKQRIAIARAILHDPPVLILDEATSAVDAGTEKKIQLAIANLVVGRTTIAISHRLATLRNADRLIVIEDGRILEQGTHDELLSIPDGHFASLVRLQSDINKLRTEQKAW